MLLQQIVWPICAIRISSKEKKPKKKWLQVTFTLKMFTHALVWKKFAEDVLLLLQFITLGGQN